MKIFFAAAGLLASAALYPAQPAHAQSKGMLEALAACRSETDDQRRLRCFDAAAASLQRATASGSVMLVDKEDVRRTRRSLFGFSVPKLPFFGGDDTADEAPEEMQAKLTEARSLGGDKWQLVLEGGAVWQTTQAASYWRTPKSGQMVKLKRGTMGSYFASVDGGRTVRAMRVR